MHSAVVTQHLRQPAPNSTLGYQYRSTGLGRSLIAAVTRHQILTLCNIPLEYKGADPCWAQRFPLHARASAGIRLHLALVWMWLANGTVGIETLLVSPISVSIAAVKREANFFAFSRRTRDKKCDSSSRRGTQYERLPKPRVPSQSFRGKGRTFLLHIV